MPGNWLSNFSFLGGKSKTVRLYTQRLRFQFTCCDSGFRPARGLLSEQDFDQDGEKESQTILCKMALDVAEL